MNEQPVAVKRLIESTMVKLSKISQTINPAVCSVLNHEYGLIVWSEGGEWPCYDDRYSGLTLGANIRTPFMGKTIECSSMELAMTIIQRHPSNLTYCSLAMHFDLSELSTLLLRIIDLRLGRNVIVVTSSTLVAETLTTDTSTTGIGCVGDYADMRLCQILTYMSSGAFIKMLMAGKLELSTVVVIFDMQAETLTMKLVRCIAPRLHNVIISMSSSKPLVNSNVDLQFTANKITSLSQYLPIGAIPTGIGDECSLGIQPTMLSEVKFCSGHRYIDTGTRLRPCVVGRVLKIVERKASPLELTKTIKWFGIVGQGATLTCSENSDTQESQATNDLYELLYDAMSVVLGLKCGNIRESINLWRSLGQLPIGTIGHDTTRHRMSFDTGTISEDSSTTEMLYYDTRNYNTILQERTGYNLADKINVVSLDDYWIRMYAQINTSNPVNPGLLPYDGAIEEEYDAIVTARSVLAGQMEPLYSESEILSIILLWNRYVLSLGRRCADVKRIFPFARYFREWRYCRIYLSRD